MIRSSLRFFFAKKSPIRKPSTSRFQLLALEDRCVPAGMYDLQWLGTVSPTDNWSMARAINDNGQIVGTSAVVDSVGITSYDKAFSWTASGGIASLGSLNASSITASETYATAINNNGAIAGIGHFYVVPYRPNGGGYYEWAFYNNGSNTTIPGHDQIGGHSVAYGINDAGVVVGNADPLGQAYKFDTATGSFTWLSTLGGRWSYGMDINNAGQVVGMADTGANPSTQAGVYQSYYHASLWAPDGTIKDLGSLGAESYANKINDLGMVVGYSTTLDTYGNPYQYHPFLYNGKSMVDLGGLGGNGFANSINNAGQIVGGSGNPSTNAAWIYENGVVYNLNTLVNASTGTLTEAYDINNSGQIVGIGMHNGHYEAFLLNPTSAAAPSNPTITVTGGSFTYDGNAHTATATAVGKDSVTPVNGSFTFTYTSKGSSTGSSTPPTSAGTYVVDAIFTSSDANYTNGSATGTLTIGLATPSFSGLNSPTINQGAASVTLTGHLAAGTVVPAGSSVSLTLNGVTQSALVDSSGNFASTFATGTLAPGSYPIRSGFAGDGANFLSATDGAATLTVVPASTNAPQVTTQPKPVTTESDRWVTFTAEASGTPTPSVQWQVSTDGGRTFKNLRGETKTSLNFEAATKQNGYEYRAVFTNAAGQAVSASAKLTVRTSPKVTLNPEDQETIDGASVTFTANATSATPVTVQWQVSFDGGKTFVNIDGATSATLTFIARRGQNGFQYRAVFTNATGQAISEVAKLKVELPSL